MNKHKTKKKGHQNCGFIPALKRPNKSARPSTAALCTPFVPARLVCRFYA